jgi:endoglucanase
MDWVDYRADGSFQPTVLPGAPKEASPVGSYDAVRVYLWAGLAPASMPGAGAVLQSVLGMQRYLADHPVPPRIVDARGQVAAADGPVGFSAALLPYLAALRARRSLTDQQDRLAALFDPATHLYGSPPRYYDQVLALFAEGCQQRRYCFSAEGDLHTGWNAGPMRGNRNRHTLSTQSQAREIP